MSGRSTQRDARLDLRCARQGALVGPAASMTGPSRPAANAALDFTAACGKLGMAVATFDWSRTSLGPLSGWPNHMRLLLETLLCSSNPLVTLWGPQGVMIYNDSFATLIGERPSLLGARVLDGWPDAAELHDRLLRPGAGPEKASFRAPRSKARHDSNSAAARLPAMATTTRAASGWSPLLLRPRTGHRNRYPPRHFAGTSPGHAAGPGGSIASHERFRRDRLGCGRGGGSRNRRIPGRPRGNRRCPRRGLVRGNLAGR